MASILLKNATLQFTNINDKSFSLRNALFSCLKPMKRHETSKNFAALKDITLDFENGDRVGLIGHNGAGKSTLLRLIAGIYEPTIGSCVINGNITTLFDLYCGMDEEASGQENLYIAGLIVGLSKDEVKKIENDVRDFSELGDFFYKSVKTYSSGMRIRLAFGLISAIESEIFLVDEIIGVGDSLFMKKALERVNAKVEKSKIFILASHSESILKDFCNRGIVLNKGSIVFDGNIEDAIKFSKENM